jgi:hypothetical protein
MFRRLILLLSAATLLGLTAGVSRADAAQEVSLTDSLQVWNLNTDRLGQQGDTDYRDFVAYISDPARARYAPDIITLQEVGTHVGTFDFPVCSNFVDELETRTGRGYTCFQTRERGGAAIAYRDARLTKVTSHPFLLKALDTATDSCPIDRSDGPWTALVGRFSDNKATPVRYVNVASLHLPQQPTGPHHDCTWENMKLADSEVDGLGSASMKIMAGDLNHADAFSRPASPDDWTCWFKGTNTDLSTCGGINLGWKDAMYRDCAPVGTGRSAGEIYDCLQANHKSYNDRRIDFLLTKTSAIEDPKVTVPYDEANVSAGQSPSDPVPYSDHRGQGALLKY